MRKPTALQREIEELRWSIQEAEASYEPERKTPLTLGGSDGFPRTLSPIEIAAKKKELARLEERQRVATDTRKRRQKQRERNPKLEQWVNNEENRNLTPARIHSNLSQAIARGELSVKELKKKIGRNTIPSIRTIGRYK